MLYAHVRGVWRAPNRPEVARGRAANEADNRTEYASETFRALGRLLDRDEYEDMLAQWRFGHREIWIENGFVMTRYTPPSVV
jgi:hypothetical protein